MDRGVAVALTACAGGLVALQAPINHLLGGRVGTFGAATISFLVGTLLLLAITALTGGAKLSGLGSLPWYYFLGGALGIAYVTTVLVTVGPLGAGGVTAATIAGQLMTALVVDRLGILGLTQKPLSAPRLAGVVLLAAGVFLIVRE